MYGTHKKPEVLYSLERVETRAQEQLANLGLFLRSPSSVFLCFPFVAESPSHPQDTAVSI